LTEEIRTSLRNAVQGRGSLKNLDTIWEGSRKTFSLKIIPVVLENGRSGVALIIEDLTEQNEERLSHEMTRRSYEALLEDNIQYIVRFNPENTIISTNDAFASHIGMPGESLAGSPFLTPFPAESFQNFTAAIGTISQNKPVIEIEIQRVVHSGEYSWERWKIRGLFDSFTGLLSEFHAVGLDITEFKRSEKELNHYKNNLETVVAERTNELRTVNSELHKEMFHRKTVERELVLMKYAIDHAHDLIFLLTHDGIIRYMNMKAQKLTGYREEQGVNIRDILSHTRNPDNETFFTPSPEEIVRSGMITTKGFIQNTEGFRVPFEITITLIQDSTSSIFCYIARDISERKKIERDLAVYRKHLETIVEERTRRLQQEIDVRSSIEQSLKNLSLKHERMADYSSEAIFIIDIGKREIINTNHRAEQFFGYTSGDIIPEIEKFLQIDRNKDGTLAGKIRKFLNQAIPGMEMDFSGSVEGLKGGSIQCWIHLTLLPADDQVILRLGCIMMPD
jgi:PAS domain S-box-containing protein